MEMHQIHRERQLTPVTDRCRPVQLRSAQAFSEADAAASTASSSLKLEHAPFNLGVMRTIGPLTMADSSPRFAGSIPGVAARRIVEPEVTRRISLVSISGRRVAPAAQTFIRAANAHPWRS